MPTAAFDFDNTLIIDGCIPNSYLIRRMKFLHELGWDIFILTARNIEHERSEWIKENEPNRIRVLEFVEDFKLPIDRIIYLNHQPKAPVLKWCKVDLFYDDEFHEGIPKECTWINTSFEFPAMSVICPGGIDPKQFHFVKDHLLKLALAYSKIDYHPFMVSSAMIQYGFGILLSIISDSSDEALKRELKCKAQETLYDLYHLVKEANKKE